jgi:hypothetical protein
LVLSKRRSQLKQVSFLSLFCFPELNWLQRERERERERILRFEAPLRKWSLGIQIHMCTFQRSPRDGVFLSD